MTPKESQRHTFFLRTFTAHEPALRGYVRRLVPTRADADDVMQEVSVVLWSKFAEFREGADFRAWAYGVARYEVLAWRRDQGRDRLVLDEAVVTKLADEVIPFDRQRDALEGCLDKVPPSQRGLLMEAYQPGARFQQVAADSGRTVAGFYQWLHRMRRLLLECVQRELGKEVR